MQPGKPVEQFTYFTLLSGWLLQKCGSNFMEMADLELQDPNSVCTNLLIEAKKLGFQTDLPPAKLRSGNGESVCRLLEFLADRALVKTKFQVRSTVFETFE